MSNKSKSKKLTLNSEGYQAVQRMILSYWRRFGSNISKWPLPAHVFEEIEDVMAPYGDNRQHRLAKFRTLYNRLTKQIFVDNGKLLFSYINYISA